MKVLHLFSVITLLTLSLAAGKAQAQEEDHKVRVINQTSSPIVQLYASGVTEARCGCNMLGADSILTSRYMLFNFDDGTGNCRYDLKAVLADGRVVIKRDLDVCEEPSWTVTDEN